MLGLFLMRVETCAHLWGGEGMAVLGYPPYEPRLESGGTLAVIGSGFLYRGQIWRVRPSNGLNRFNSMVAVFVTNTSNPDPPQGIQPGMDVYLLPSLDGLGERTNAPEGKRFFPHWPENQSLLDSCKLEGLPPGEFAGNDELLLKDHCSHRREVT